MNVTMPKIYLPSMLLECQEEDAWHNDIRACNPIKLKEKMDFENQLYYRNVFMTMGVDGHCHTAAIVVAYVAPCQERLRKEVLYTLKSEEAPLMPLISVGVDAIMLSGILFRMAAAEDLLARDAMHTLVTSQGVNDHPEEDYELYLRREAARSLLGHDEDINLDVSHETAIPSGSFLNNEGQLFEAVSECMTQ